jgi:hypothetical protein
MAREYEDYFATGKISMRKWWRIGGRLLVIAGTCAMAFAQDFKPAIENQHVSVWDVRWRDGVTNPVPGRDRDVVVLWIAGPQARTSTFIAKGSPHDVRGSEGSRSLIVELKDAPAARYENTGGYPAAFPRPHDKKLLENDRVVVWFYRWNPGEPTPMHFHDKDALVVYLEPTALVSTTPDGSKTENDYKAFDIRFHEGNRTHTELLARGNGSAMIMELK